MLDLITWSMVVEDALFVMPTRATEWGLTLYLIKGQIYGLIEWE
jgi:hypothetical protein